MKQFFSSIVSIMAILFLNTAYSLDAPMNLHTTNVGSDYMELSWDSVEGAIGYSVYYGGIDTDFSDITGEIVESPSHYISGLTAGELYNVSVTTFDEQGQESQVSDVLEVMTKDQAEIAFNAASTQAPELIDQTSFKLETVEVLSKTEIVLSFNANLSNEEGVIREFKIVNTEDSLNQIEVSKATITQKNGVNIGNKLTLEFASELVENTTYELTIIAIEDEQGRTIELGVDSLEKFTVPVFKIEENTQNTVDVIQENIIDAGVTENTKENLDLGGPIIEENSIAGVTITEENMIDTVLSSAQENKDLPQTGPEHILIFILTFILGTLIFILRYKKI